METTYTQQIDEKTGEIKYVPNSPPPPPEGGGNGANQESRNPHEEEVRSRYKTLDFDIDPTLTQELENLLANSKRLRYDKRLETGKLDGKRLNAYKTSKRLFKKKAIKDRNYQFTFLMDTSGSMFGAEEGQERCKMEMSSDAVAKTVKSLEAIKMRSSVFSMNQAFELIKPFDQSLDDTKFANDIVRTCAGVYKTGDGAEVDRMGGTFEWVAYEQTMKYLAQNTPHGATNVVIILSDGAPGGAGRQCLVTIDGQSELVPSQGEKDNSETLARFWDKQLPTLAFGIGIQSKAKQVPTNKTINNISKLPDVLGNLLTELML